MSNFRYEFSEVYSTIRLGYKTRQDKTTFIKNMFLINSKNNIFLQIWLCQQQQKDNSN